MLLALLGCAPDEVDALDPGPACDPDVDLAAAEAAAATYTDPALAEADGYVLQGECEADERGAAMGAHWVRLADSLDQEHAVEVPEALLYVPEGAGWRLVGIEYVRPALVDGQTVTEDAGDAFDPPPELFCRSFDGPMEGHVPLQPWHYDLHVWLFSENPDGLFAPFNPSESCSP